MVAMIMLIGVLALLYNQLIKYPKQPQQQTYLISDITEDDRNNMRKRKIIIAGMALVGVAALGIGIVATVHIGKR